MCIIFGFNERMSVGEMDHITCPRCHNAGCVRKGKSRDWFELFWMPLIPMGRKDDIAICTICNWKAIRPKDADQHQQAVAKPAGGKPQ